ncbi:hypothetical protein SY83_04935 [Paenibacillus swuensis]|uniref:Cation/H+ exchanger transmembrane domain-containing protein n=1 Tax=Paenibacillus swuensis TaxID=1178515 RepID=A0A172TFD2_9BACL|nr:Na+/H+ antiporter [Paenibacillus swuensis]ANE45751.1 hypothetical protein SY83_04935 [Paenibacillus swuensis]
MELFLAVLLLLTLVGVSNILNRLVPFVPVPLFQIALGMFVAVIPSGMHELELDPHLFFVLFVAPLLFKDGKRTPRDELWKLRSPILFLSLGLVLATVIIGGYAIHAMIPSIPLPAAFALAAILSPTDPVAVGALAGRIHLPKRILRLLEGEALMNDASGLVAFKFAVAATVTGVFSASNAAFSFLVIAAGGLLSGVILSFLIIWLRVFIRHWGMEDVTMHMLIQILTPFAIFLISEHFGVSGILAVVAGGIVHAVERDRTESAQVKLQIVSASTWAVMLFLLNGLVFVILGLQIPAVAEVIFEAEQFNNVQVIGYILAISAGLILLRFVWVYLYALVADREDTKNRLHSSVLVSLSGVRGAVTLAGAFSIPFILQDGSPFPERELLIFLAAGVILVSLLVASIVLPLVAHKAPSGGLTPEEREKQGKLTIMRAAAETIRLEMNEGNRAATRSVVSSYHRQLLEVESEGGGLDQGKELRDMTRKVHLLGIKIERKALVDAFTEGKISAEGMKRYQFVLDQTQWVLSNRWRFLSGAARYTWNRIRDVLFSKGTGGGLGAQDVSEMNQLRILTAKAAIAELKKIVSDQNKDAAHTVISHYQDVLERLKVAGGPREEDTILRQKKEIQLRAIQVERDEIQRLYEEGTFNRSLANKLRSYVNFREAAVFEEEDLL